MSAERIVEQPVPSAEAPGAQLKALREALGWSVDYVADQLKLAPRQVLALEENDVLALPNPAVVRGFIRAYAKVVKTDPMPLVAMINIHPLAEQMATPVRHDILPTSARSRFPSMTQRSSAKPGRWIAAALVIVVLAGFGAYRLGYLPSTLLSHSAPPAASTSALETTLLKPGQEAPALQSKAVPLISVTSAPESSAAAPAAPATTGIGTNALVLNARSDSWVEVRRTAGGAPLMARLMRASTSETLDITEPVLLIVGKPGALDVTLRGAALELPAAVGSAPLRLNLK